MSVTEEWDHKRRLNRAFVRIAGAWANAALVQMVVLALLGWGPVVLGFAVIVTTVLALIAFGLVVAWQAARPRWTSSHHSGSDELPMDAREFCTKGR